MIKFLRSFTQIILHRTDRKGQGLRPLCLFGSAAVAAALLAALPPIYAIPLPAATTTTLAVTVGSSPVTTVSTGTVVMLTARVVSGTNQVMLGVVNFCNASASRCAGINLLGTAEITAAGRATMMFRPGQSLTSIKAVFVGTKTYATSTSSASSLAVTNFPTTTSVAKSGSAGNYTLTATVTGSGSTSAPGTTVNFTDTTNTQDVLASGTLGAGTVAQSFGTPVGYGTGTTPFSPWWGTSTATASWIWRSRIMTATR